MKFKLLLVFLALSTYAIAQNTDYNDNQLFLKFKENTVKDFDFNQLKSLKQFSNFNFLSFEKCFKINDAELNKIFILTFETKKGKIDELILELEKLKTFEYVEKVPVYNHFYTPNDLQSNQWNLYKINAENAWNYSKGSNKIIIAIVDDGLDTAHQDLESLIWRNKNEIRGNGIDDDGNGYVDDFIGWDFASNDNIPHCGYNTGLEHGTHCAGIVGAKTDNNIGIAGIAYGCQLMITKHGLPFQNAIYNAYQGVEYAIINKANVISMSWGGGGYSQTYQSLFDYAYKQGIVCVAAAGNNYSNVSMYPASYNRVISVGSTSSNDVKSNFSNYGIAIDVMAPGSNIYSTLPDNRYGNMSGTSMACPLVSGLCGLMLSFNPNYSVDEIESCLKNGCDNINSMNSSITGLIGAGRINAEKSLKCMKPIVADFQSNFKQQCPGDTVSYSDLTVKTPTSLLWTFQGGTPSSSTLPNPKIIYNTAGVYDVKLIAYSNLGNDTIVKKAFITIAKPTAKISLTRNINLGASTTLKVDFTGNAPFQFTYSDGVNTKTISNVYDNPYFLRVSPVQNTQYTITSFKDSRCVGNYSGVGVVNINKGVNCKLATKFQASLGGTLDDFAYSVVEDKFGNYAIAGSTKSYGNGDAFLTKWNKEGEMLWFKTYGANSTELFYNVINTNDNGYLLMGVTASYSSSDDALLIKVDSSGTVQWSKTMGGSSMNEFFYRGVQLENGNFILGGSYQSAGAGREDNLLIKIDANGNLIWTKIYGNSRYNVITGLAVNKDGSIVFSSSYENPYGELAIVKVDSNGTILWNKLFGGSDPEAAYDMTLGQDGNIYLVGTYRPTSNNMDMCIASFDQSGNTRFIKTYGGSLNDVLYRVKPYNDELVAVGYSQSYGSGGMDGQVIRFDTTGNVVGQNNFGASSDDIFLGLNMTQDGGFIMVGSTKSFGSGGQDIFINKVNCEMQVGCHEKSTAVKFWSNLTSSSFTQSVTSAGSFTNQTITATKRNLSPSVNCKVLSNKSNCLKVDTVYKINSSSNGFTGQLDNSDYFGQTVRNFGDFDGDGIDDMVVGSQLDDDGGTNQGAVYIILLNKNGSIKSFQKISSTQGGFNGSLSGSNYFGSGVSKLTDLNGDGIQDLVVGHNYDNTGATRAGAVWVIFLNSNGTVKSHQKIANGTGGFPNILDSDDIFGNDVSEIGDINGDGLTDILVGAPYDDDGGTDRGAVYIICLNSNGTVKTYQKISSSVGGLTGLKNDDAFGYGVSSGFDFNKDGKKDFIVGSRKDDDGGLNRGAVWILYLNSSNTILKSKKISSAQGGFYGQLDNDDYFGTGVDVVGDIDGDNNYDILITSTYDDDGGTDRGATWLLLLDSIQDIKSYVKISSTAQQKLNNRIDNDDLFGWRASFLNDNNNDGFKELIIGAMRDDDGGTDRGAVYILNLSDTCFFNNPILPKCKIYPDFAIEENCLNQTFIFKDLSKDSNKNKINYWEWDFGDGFKQYNSNIVYHVYKSSGVKNIKLKVGIDGSFYCEDSIVKSIFVSDSLKVTLSDTNTICKNDSSVLKIEKKYCGVSPFTYEWTPSNGLSNPYVMEPKASPSSSTTYFLKVTDGTGKIAKDSTHIVVKTDCCKSHPDFNINTLLFCSYDSVQLTNTSTFKNNAIFVWKIKGNGNKTFTQFQPSKFKLISSGTYTITLVLNDSCGIDSISKEIMVMPYIQPIAGNDSSVCMPDSFLIGGPGLSRNIYEWMPTTGLNNPNISQPFAKFLIPIVYTLKMTDELGCISYDTIAINNLKSQQLNLGNDTSICEGESVQLISNVNASQYQWNTGSNTQQIIVNTQGLYWLEIKSNQCLQRDSLYLTVNKLPVFTLGRDTVICDLNQYEIKPNIDVSNKLKLWQNGSTNPSFIASTKGLYWLELNENNCNYRDSVLVDFSSKPKRKFNIDTSMCEGDSIAVDATDALAISYEWSNGSTKSKLVLKEKGNFTVKIKNNCGESQGEIEIKHKPSAFVNLGLDTSICSGDTIKLNAFHANAKKYLWNNGDTNSYMIVNKPGNYSVEVYDGCQMIKDDKTIDSLVCNCLFYFPNAFSPYHSKNINDVFLPEIESGCEPSSYKLSVFDRWGGEVFTTYNYKEGWNGLKNGRELPVGAYVYVVTLQVLPQYFNQVYQKSGIVILMD